MAGENAALIQRWFDEVWSQGHVFDQLSLLQQLGVVTLPA